MPVQSATPMPYGTGCGSIRTLPGLVSPVAGARTAANRAPAAIFPRDSPLFPLYDCQMIVPPSSDDNLMFVRDQLGIACLAWVVGDIAQSPSEKQAATIDVLASQIRDAIGTRPDLPLSLVVSHMASSFIPAIGNTLLNQLKEETSPYQEPLPHTDDNTLNALRALARAVYCQLLLPSEDIPGLRVDPRLPESSTGSLKGIWLRRFCCVRGSMESSRIAYLPSLTSLNIWRWRSNRPGTLLPARWSMP